MTGGRPLILAGWLGIFIYGYLNAMLGIVLPNLMEKLKLSKSQAGVFFMTSSIGLIVASVPSGLTMDALGTKLVVCLGLFLVAIAFWGLGIVSTAKALYSMAFVLGLGGSMVVAGENTAISLVNSTQREIAANLLNLFFGVGAFVAPFLVMPVLKRRGFTGVLKVSSVLTLVILALHLVLSFPKPLVAQGFPLAQTGALLDATQIVASDVPGFSLCGHRVLGVELDRHILHHRARVYPKASLEIYRRVCPGHDRGTLGWPMDSGRLRTGAGAADQRRGIRPLSGWDVHPAQAHAGCHFDHGGGLVHGCHLSDSFGIGRNVLPNSGRNRNQPGDYRRMAGCDRDSSRGRVRGESQRSGSGRAGSCRLSVSDADIALASRHSALTSSTAFRLTDVCREAMF